MIEVPELAGDTRLRHGFFTRDGGFSGGLFSSLNCGFGSGDDKPTVARNRESVAAQLDAAPDRLLTVRQWHSADALTVTDVWDVQQPPQADALVTNVRRIAIGVLTADCAPVLFADRNAGVIGAAHAGWKGALAGVTAATIAAMEKLGAVRSRITAVIGPTIAQENYEVGPEFAAHFLKEDEDNQVFFRSASRTAHHMFDLPGYLARKLAIAGVGHVNNTALCTYQPENRFFSYRRATHGGEKQYGRQISAIMLT
ncbi:peptidoglycan editing factor PgeF [soil metagenome]